MRIGVTGGAGFLGWHLRCFLHTLPGVEATVATKETFASEGVLRDFAAQCDAIVHLAALNRGDENELFAVNVALTSRLLSACDAAGVAPHIVFSSSTHIHRDTAYGRSKRESARLITDWAAARGTTAAIVVLPNIFGEGCRPFYNSVVATFSYQLASGQPAKVDSDQPLELLHAQQAAEIIAAAVQKRTSVEVSPRGRAITVGAILEKLSSFCREYSSGVIPDLSDPFDRDLFNTYRSYLFPQKYPWTLNLCRDDRGQLFEAIKSHNGGQVFLSTTKPGITRGNHFHRRKVERFLVVSGEASIRLRRLFSSEVHQFPVSGARPQVVDIPTLHAHNITNEGSTEVMTLFWANEIYDVSAPDTTPETV
jgi:UDP-2-acetamido-2,6-beta-L-arabino-hexul-4-ose reductase